RATCLLTPALFAVDRRNRPPRQAAAIASIPIETRTLRPADRSAACVPTPFEIRRQVRLKALPQQVECRFGLSARLRQRNMPEATVRHAHDHTSHLSPADWGRIARANTRSLPNFATAAS